VQTHVEDCGSSCGGGNACRHFVYCTVDFGVLFCGRSRLALHTFVLDGKEITISMTVTVIHWDKQRVDSIGIGNVTASITCQLYSRNLYVVP
jgi:hypothetical protein